MTLRFWGGLGDEIAITGLVRELRLAHPREQLTVEGNRYPELFFYNPHLGVPAKIEATENGKVIDLVPAPNDTVGNFVYAYAQFCGLPTIGSAEPEVFLTPAEIGQAQKTLGPRMKPLVMIDTWAAWPRRRWPFERFAEVTMALRATGHRVIEVGTTAPDSQGERRTQRLPIDPSDCLLDLHAIRETAALLSQATLFIGNDSGLAHLAAAVGTPAVILYSVPWYARAYRTTYPVFSLQHDCVGCMKKCVRDPKERCLTSLTVPHVMRVVEAAINETL